MSPRTDVVTVPPAILLPLIFMHSFMPPTVFIEHRLCAKSLVLRHWYTTLNKMVRSLAPGASSCCPHALTPTPLKMVTRCLAGCRTGHLEGKDVAEG